MPSHELWHTPQAQLLTFMGLTVLEKEGTFEEGRERSYSFAVAARGKSRASFLKGWLLQLPRS